MGTLSNPRKRRQRAASYEVLDRAQLARTLRDAIRAVVGDARGAHARAAKQIGISRGQLSKLLHQDRPALDSTTVEKLGAWLPASLRGEFVEALLSPLGNALLIRYNRWRARTHLDLVTPMAPHWTAGANGDAGPGEESSIPWADAFDDKGTDDATVGYRDAIVLAGTLTRDIELPALSGFVRRHFPDLIHRFEEIADRHRTSPARRALALDRALAPLVAAGESGQIERHWSEMIGADGTCAELREYLAASLAAESVLLRREPDAVRANQHASRAVSASPEHTLPELVANAREGRFNVVGAGDTQTNRPPDAGTATRRKSGDPARKKRRLTVVRGGI